MRCHPPSRAIGTHTLNAQGSLAVLLHTVPNDKTPPKGAAAPASEPETSSTSGEYVRRTNGEREPFRSQSTTRRAMPQRARAEEAAASPPPAAPRKKSAEEQTLRSAKVPQRIRMSLRMRRVAAAAPGKGAEPVPRAEPFRADERVGLRLGGRSIELPVGREVIAGRAAECELLLDDRLCSRRHAVFSRAADGSATVRDLGSSNGTYVNGVRISTQQRLERGDWTTIGNETLELCVLPSAPQGVSPTIPAGPRRDTSASQERASSKTEPGNPLLSLASLAVNVAGHAPPRSGPGLDAARKSLDALLRRLERGETIRESDAEMAGTIALHLGNTTSDPEWLDYLFRLYTARRSPMPAGLLDRLEEALPAVPGSESAKLRAYVEVLQGAPEGTWNEAQQRLLTRLDQLQRQHAGKRH